MDENNELGYNDIALDEKIQAFIEEQKKVIELCKFYDNETGGQKGYRVEFNPKTKSYSVYFVQTNILISTEDKDGKFNIRKEGISEFEKLTSLFS